MSTRSWNGPTCPEGELEPERVDLIALTHGHYDHVGDTVALHATLGCPVIAQVELRGWLTAPGLPDDGWRAPRTRAARSRTTGSRSRSPTRTLLQRHDGTLPASRPASSRGRGRVTIYFAGDTNVFGDMALIGRIYEPDVAVLPIGDHYTMGPREAAVALELLGVPAACRATTGRSGCSPGRRSASRARSAGVEILSPEPGETVALMRERWFGATGRKVPEIVLEGTVDLEGALVLDDVSDSRRSTRPPRRQARRGPRVDAEAVHAALSLGPVACVLVPDERPPLARPRGMTYG